MIDDFNPVHFHPDPMADSGYEPARFFGGGRFEFAAQPETLDWHDVSSQGGGFDIAADDWFDPDSPGKEHQGPQFSIYGDDGATELPPIDVVGRRQMTLEEIDAIIAAYNASNTDGPASSGGGGGGTTQSLGPDLSQYDCQHLANLEAQIRSNMEAARSFAIGLLNVTAPFQGESTFNEIWNVFESLNQQGLYDANDPWGTMSRVTGQTVTGTDLIDLSMLGIASNVTITAYQLFMVQSAFAYQLNLDRIDAEQARRGGGCGT